MQLTVIATGVVMAMLYFLRNIIVPLVLAFVLVILVDALVGFIGERFPRIPHWVNVALAALVATMSAGTAAFIITRGIGEIARDAPTLLARADRLLGELAHNVGIRKPMHLATLTRDANVADVLASIAADVGALASGLVLMLTYFVFIVAGRGNAQRKIANSFGSGDRSAHVEAVIAHVSDKVQAYVWVHTICAFIVAGCGALVMFAARLHDPQFWTVLLFLLCFIPTIGVTVGSIIPALFALLQFDTLWQSALIFGGIQLGAMIVGNLIYPRLQAQAQNMDPLATLIALAFWGLLWGIPGAFLSVPLTMIVMMICAQFPRARWIAVLLSNDGRPPFRSGVPESQALRINEDASGDEK